MPLSYYNVLEVPEDAAMEEIRRSYRRMALRYHPDKAGPESEAKFKEISAAYEVLSDPEKRAIYDRYGEAGLSAMGNSMTGSAITALGALCFGATIFLVLLLCVVMFLTFLVFLACHVDGRFTSWSYTKVFAPIFVLDVLIVFPVLILTLVSFAVLHRVDLGMYLLGTLCLIVQSVLVPIGKDRNEARAREGRTDFLQWRVWLIPCYAFALFLLLGVVARTYPLQRRRWKAKAFGLHYLARYLPYGFCLCVLNALSVLALFVLVACRADEVITIDWFLCIGLPCFLSSALLLVDILVRSVLSTIVLHTASESEAPSMSGASASEQGPFESGPSSDEDTFTDQRNSRTVGSSMTGSTALTLVSGSVASAYHTEGASAATGNTGARNRSRRSRGSRSTASRKNGSYRSQRPASSVCGRITRAMILIGIIIGLALATVVMVCVRLNHYYQHHTYEGVLTLAKAFIPAYLLLGLVILVLGMMLVLLVYGVAQYDVREGEDGAEMSSQELPPEADLPMVPDVHSAAAASEEEEGAFAAGAEDEREDDESRRRAAHPRENISDID